MTHISQICLLCSSGNASRPKRCIWLWRELLRTGEHLYLLFSNKHVISSSVHPRKWTRLILAANFPLNIFQRPFQFAFESYIQNPISWQKRLKYFVTETFVSRHHKRINISLHYVIFMFRAPVLQSYNKKYNTTIKLSAQCCRTLERRYTNSVDEYTLREKLFTSKKNPMGLIKWWIGGAIQATLKRQEHHHWEVHEAFTRAAMGYDDEVRDFSPMIPLSLLSSVELRLVMVPQGLERLRGGRLAVLLSVEHGLSVLGDAVLLVSVEQGLMPWLVTEHWRWVGGREMGQGMGRMCSTNQTCQLSMKSNHL